MLAGAGGIEPPNGGIKIRCLTAWLRPNARWRSGPKHEFVRAARTIAAAACPINVCADAI